jgi:hypothetical protein
MQTAPCRNIRGQVIGSFDYGSNYLVELHAANGTKMRTVVAAVAMRADRFFDVPAWEFFASQEIGRRRSSGVTRISGLGGTPKFQRRNQNGTTHKLAPGGWLQHEGVGGDRLLR